MTLRAAVARMAACAACTALPFVAARGQGVSSEPPQLDSATAARTLKSSCGAADAKTFGMLRGSVRDSEDHSKITAAVTVVWHRAEEHAGVLRPGSDEVTLGVLAGDDGGWRVCGVPLQTHVSVRAAADEGTDEHGWTLDQAHSVGTLDLLVHPLSEVGAASRTPRTSALVVFSVSDHEGHALGGVNLELEPANGPTRTAVSDAEGRAIIPAVEPGRARIRTRGIGYVPGELSLPLDLGRNTVPLTLDHAHIPVLATVRVIGDRPVLPRHMDFEMRRAQGLATASITADDIAKRNPLDTWQMLTNVPAVRIGQLGMVGGVYAWSNRGNRLVQNRTTFNVVSMPCFYRLMIDGVPFMDTMPDLTRMLPPPSEVHGIEVFAGLATVPPQYNSSAPDGSGGSRSAACGLIAIWTK